MTAAAIYIVATVNGKGDIRITLSAFLYTSLRFWPGFLTHEVMKKILLVYNAETYSEHLTRFALKLSRQTGALLHAVFVSPLAQQISQYPFPGTLPLVASELTGVEEIQRERQHLVSSNIDLFSTSCSEAGILFKADSDIDITIEDVIDHSAFADLILFDAREQFGAYSFKDLLSDTHCPVILVPENATTPQKAILCYDESFSSIYAIKQYGYLFPDWNDLPTYLLSINPKGDNGNKFDDYLDDWLPAHFSNLEKIELQGNLQTELTSYIKKDDSRSIVIMGAYGGNAVSRIFHRSLVNVVLEETSASVFVIHE